MTEHILSKSFMTNFIALGALIFGLVWSQQALVSIGLFAFSGGFTNWIAIHMLFERVPGFYGSGVIQNRFVDFKHGIEALIMQEFFTVQNIGSAMGQKIFNSNTFDIKKIFAQLPLENAFEALLDAVSTSSLGGLLNMVGGIEALRPMQPAFEQRLRIALEEIAETSEFKAAIAHQMQDPRITDEIHAKIEKIVKSRLDQLTPNMVKNLIQNMIRQHLGWLVVWGGIFGGLIGLVAYLLESLS